MIKIALIGANGKVSKAIAQIIQDIPEFTITSGYARSPFAAPFLITKDLSQALSSCDIAIDFSLPSLTSDLLKAAISQQTPLVIGTTGLSQEQHDNLTQASKTLPIFYASNFSIGIAMLHKIAHLLSSNLDGSWSLDLIDIHHKHKKDAPSGTAVSIAKETKERAQIHSLRTGEIFGEHTLLAHTAEERLEIKHAALNRLVFARSALKAAAFLHHKPPGLYTMEDLINKEQTCTLSL